MVVARGWFDREFKIEIHQEIVLGIDWIDARIVRAMETELLQWAVARWSEQV